jgi:hypothetical protein
MPTNNKPAQKFCSFACKEKHRDKRRRQNPEYMRKARDRYNKRYSKKYSIIKVNSGHNVFWKINLRCNNPASTSYKWYGAKGIKNLLTKEEFLSIYWNSNKCAICSCDFNDDNRTCGQGRTIDRINSNEHYHVNNVRIVCRSCNSRLSQTKKIIP